MNIDAYRSILAGHELAEFDYIKRRVGSIAMIADREANELGMDFIVNQLTYEEFATVRAQEESAPYAVPELHDPVLDAELSLKFDLEVRFGDIDGYTLSFADATEGLGLVKHAPVANSDLAADDFRLSCLPTPGNDLRITKTRRITTASGEKYKESLPTTEDDFRILEEAFTRLASINEALQSK